MLIITVLFPWRKCVCYIDCLIQTEQVRLYSLAPDNYKNDDDDDDDDDSNNDQAVIL